MQLYSVETKEQRCSQQQKHSSISEHNVIYFHTVMPLVQSTD